MKRFLSRLETDSTTTLMLRSERFRQRSFHASDPAWRVRLTLAHRALAAKALLRFHEEADPNGRGVALVKAALSEALAGLSVIRNTVGGGG